MSILKYIFVFFFVAIYVFLGYFIERTEFSELLLLYGIVFILYLFFVFTTNDKKEVSHLLWFSILFRCLFIFATPILSDDYYRFIWDGNLFIHGYNPYLFLPSEIVNTDMAQSARLTEELYKGLNSPHYYTVYPPINQLLFSIGAFFSKFGMLWGIVAIRIPILIAEVYTLIYLQKIIGKLRLPRKNVLWYALNPLVIIELSGNLHYEGLMLCCLLIAIYWLMTNRWAGAAIWWAMAISVKLIPLLFLPILIRRLGVLKSAWFYLILTSALLFTFLPFLDKQLIIHIFSSIDLYFRTFEFNASIYYIVRWVGFQCVGYNIIEKAGPTMAFTTFILILIVSFYKHSHWECVLKKMLIAYTIYLFMASTVHPWYVINLVLLSVFSTNYRYAFIWSGLIILSYYAYSKVPYQEDAILLFIEYFIVVGWFIFETSKKKLKHFFIKQA